MAARSAGLLIWRRRAGRIEVLLLHPGGPWWARKDAGAWSIPKGEIEPDEDPLAAAIREVEEETGYRATGRFRELPEIVQAGGKRVLAWAVEGDLDPAAIRSNTFEMEWPPRSGRTASFPEIDRAEFFEIEEAAVRINPAQVSLLQSLVASLA